MNDHQLLMQAVGRFWEQLEHVRARLVWIPLSTYYVGVRIQEIRNLMNDLVALRQYEQLKTLSEHRGNFFTVIFPQDDRINLFRALCEPSMDGRNLSWYAYKRGIDAKRIRNIHWEDGHMVMDIMLSENDDESQSLHDASVQIDDRSALRFSERQDPTSFSCDPSCQVVIGEANPDAASE